MHDVTWPMYVRRDNHAVSERGWPENSSGSGDPKALHHLMLSERRTPYLGLPRDVSICLLYIVPPHSTRSRVSIAPDEGKDQPVCQGSAMAHANNELRENLDNLKAGGITVVEPPCPIHEIRGALFGSIESPPLPPPTPSYSHAQNIGESDMRRSGFV